MNVLKKFRHSNGDKTFETAKKETNGQSKSLLFRQITTEVKTGPLLRMIDYEVR
jgi:hypothetical protein